MGSKTFQEFIKDPSSKLGSAIRGWDIVFKREIQPQCRLISKHLGNLPVISALLFGSSGARGDIDALEMERRIYSLLQEKRLPDIELYGKPGSGGDVNVPELADYNWKKRVDFVLEKKEKRDKYKKLLILARWDTNSGGAQTDRWDAHTYLAKVICSFNERHLNKICGLIVFDGPGYYLPRLQERVIQLSDNSAYPHILLSTLSTLSKTLKKGGLDWYMRH